MKRLLPALLFCLPLFVSAQSAGDTLSPFRVVEKYVSPNGFPEKLRHFCCEMYHEWMAPQTLGQQLAVTVQRDVRLMYEDTGRAVVNVWFHDSITSMDVYFYLQHRGVWTVYAVRTLAMKTIAEGELLRLDSIPEKVRGKNYTKSTGHTWKFDYNNTRLWGSPDTVLATHFYSNRKLFAELEAMRSKKFPLNASDTVYKKVILDKKIKKKADKILVRDITIDKYAPGCILYLLGGVLDNSVGYMYQPDATKVPPVSAGYFILIRPLGNGWYLYKTT